MNADRLEVLLDRYFDEALAPAERVELEALLLSWPQAREHFWKRARFHALLRRRGRESWGRRLALEQMAGEAEPTESRAWWRQMQQKIHPAFPWAAAAAITILLIFSAGRWSKVNKVAKAGDAEWTETANPPSTSLQGVATILRAVDVDWAGNKQRPGNVLGPGWIRFSRGLVEMQFHRGARVVLEGPAEFELISDMQARCLLGKVRAEVPLPSTGFEILSPSLRVVDRGTAFGMEVERGGLAEVHVFSGRVDFATRRTPGTLHPLLQGKAVRVDGSGGFSDIPGGSQSFTTAETVEKQANTTMAARYLDWLAQSERLRGDPALLVQYTFEGEPGASRKLTNSAPQATLESHGTIVGCSRTEGRWPGKQALDFKQIGDRIRLALPRTYEELTCLAWIRLDSLDRPYAALFMSGDAAVGELQWQIRGAGNLVFGKRKESGWGSGKLYNAESNHVLRRERCGSWMQLAFVYNAHSKSFAHYLDGQPIGTSPMNENTPLKTGALEIGNWSPAMGEPVDPIRAFNGRMDEFLVFSRALRPAEILEHWNTGRPL